MIKQITEGKTYFSRAGVARYVLRKEQLGTFASVVVRSKSGRELRVAEEAFSR
jgi:hypothetical protein